MPTLMLLLLCLVPLWCCAGYIDSRQTIPILTTTGTNYEIGREVGSLFGKQINEYYQLDKSLQKVYLPWSNTESGRKIYEDYVQAANMTFSSILLEMQGLADGANLTFKEVFLMNSARELDALLNISHIGEDACSDVHINSPACQGFGHNEDGSPNAEGRGYFINATLTSPNILGATNTQYLFYCYPGILPGNAFGLTGLGLGISINALYPQTVLPQRLVRNILTRILLEASDVKTMLALLRNPKYSAAYGFSVNVGNFMTKEITNIEVAPSDLENLVSAQTISMNQTNYHVNKYERIVIPEIPKKIVSSQHRAKRITELGAPKSFDDIRHILGDSKDKDYPIFRTPRHTDEESTLATGVFDLQEKTLSVFTGNPTNNTGLLYIFSVPFTTKT